MTRRLPSRAALSAAMLAVVLTASACSDGRQRPTTTSAGPRKPPAVFVVIGGRESSGSGQRDPLHEAWPQRVFSSRFAAGTVYVNLATDGATVAQAVARQLPVALSQKPTVVVVWLGEADVAAGTASAQYERDLRVLLGRLRTRTTTRVVVASSPRSTGSAPYTAATADAARATGAEVVRLSAPAAAATELGEAVRR